MNLRTEEIKFLKLVAVLPIKTWKLGNLLSSTPNKEFIMINTIILLLLLPSFFLTAETQASLTVRWLTMHVCI